MVTDQASYTDIVSGLFRILGYRFSPRIADSPILASGGWTLPRTTGPELRRPSAHPGGPRRSHLAAQRRRGPLEISTRRYETGATILSGNRPIEDFGTVLGDNVAAGVLLDRFLHDAEIVQLQGGSYRIHERQQRIDRAKTASSVSVAEVPQGRDALIAGLSVALSASLSEATPQTRPARANRPWNVAPLGMGMTMSGLKGLVDHNVEVELSAAARYATNRT